MGKEKVNIEQRTLDNIAASFIDIWMNSLKQASFKFRDKFVKNIANIDKEYNSCILPDGTKFIQNSENYTALVIEQKPTVRTLNFTTSAINNTSNTKFTLSLPYVVFVPIFIKGNGDLRFVQACCAWRKSPLTSCDDILYHCSLPNIKASDPMYVRAFYDMTICTGNNEKHATFYPKPGDINTMTQEFMSHFWNSNFSDELMVGYQAMRSKDPEHFSDLKKWEKHSKENPFFVLKTDWIPARNLGWLLNDIKKYMAECEHNNGSEKLTHEYITRVNALAWGEVLEASEPTRQELVKYVNSYMESSFSKFANRASLNLACINNDTIRKTVQIAMADAFREAMR